MSSILRALKKLEKNPQEKNALKPWRREPAAPKVPGRGTRGLRPRNGAFYLLLVTPFLLIGGWLLLKYGPVLIKVYSPDPRYSKQVETPTKNVPARIKKNPANAQLKPVTRQPPATAIEARTATARTRKTITASRRGTTVSGKRIKKVPADVKKNTLKAQVKPMTRRRRTAPAATLNPRTPSGKTIVASRRAPTLSGKDQNPSPRHVETRNTVRTAQPTVVENTETSDFEVQAIAWSRTPEKRIAVINSKVVREGDSVAGAYVTKIGLDDVSIKIGDKTFLLKCWR
jgi:hypothetical protein